MTEGRGSSVVLCAIRGHHDHDYRDCPERAGRPPEEIRARAVNNEGYTGHLWTQGDARQELEDCPIGSHLLADNEVDDYLALERVIHRHQFYDHDCQSVCCKAMFVLNSPEFTEILHRAYERGRDDRG